MDQGKSYLSDAKLSGDKGQQHPLKLDNFRAQSQAQSFEAFTQVHPSKLP